MIKVENKDKIAILTVSRPESYNSLNSKVIDCLNKEVFKAQNDKNTRVIIITGEGKQSFIAGADISEMESMSSKEAINFAQNGHTLMNSIEQSQKPIIAAINGFALGGGCELALSCHIRYSSNNAIFGQPESGLGLIPGFGGTQRLARIVGFGKALELLLRANKIDAQESYRIGLTNEISNGNVIDLALEKAKEIISCPSTSTSKILESMLYGYKEGISKGLENEITEFAKLFSTYNTKEGLSAFVNKRKPNYR